jgi:hypothetical protein
MSQYKYVGKGQLQTYRVIMCDVGENTKGRTLKSAKLCHIFGQHGENMEGKNTRKLLQYFVRLDGKCERL